VRDALYDPAVGEIGLAGHVGRVGAGEMAHNVGDFLRGGEAFIGARHHPILLQRSISSSLIDQRGPGKAGTPH
jgi:hypothetical protein